MTRSDHKNKKTDKSESGRIWQRVLLAIVGLILGLNLFHWNASALAGNTLPMPFGTGAAVVLSGSMSPTLEINDLIRVQKKDHYEVGDIVVFQSERDLIVHQVIAKEGDRILTQGDANNVADAPIEASAVKGAVIASVPLLGKIVNVLKIPAVRIMLLIGALLLMEQSFQRERQAEEEELDTIKAEIRKLKTELDSRTQNDSDGKSSVLK